MAPHISCIGTTRESVRELLQGYQQAGIDRMVALRGDIPSGAAGGARDVSYASQLVEFVRRRHADWFEIEVAAYPEVHPESRTPAEDIEHFRKKVAAGANGAITQYFYNPDAYFDFVERARVDVPIVPGIMPITSYANLVRFSDGCGAEIPRWIRSRLAAYQNDDESLKAFGTDVVTALCQRLIDGGAPGLHFYTLNQADATLEIWRRLGLPR